MNARLRYGLFALMCAAQLAVPASLVIKHEQTRADGSFWKFQAAPVDPADPFRGRYVRLGFAVEREPVLMADPGLIYVAYDTRMYAELEPGPHGFARLARLHQQRPVDADVDYLDVFVRQMRVNETKEDEGRPPAAMVRLPFDRYYLPEHRAPQVERDYAEAARDAQDDTYVEVHVRHGHAALMTLVLDGQGVLP